MVKTTLAKLRLINRQIHEPEFCSPKVVVSCLGAVQAQDYAMAKWAVGCRLPEVTNDVIETALNQAWADKKTDFQCIQLLPAFDEFMVSYKDRTASLLPAYRQATITGNGIFKPVIVVNGEVVGLWKLSTQKHKKGFS